MKTRHSNMIPLFLFITLSFMACEKENVVPNSECNKVIGLWEWSYSTGGFGKDLKTPQTEGYTQSIEFDNNGNQFLYLDNTIVGVNKFNFKIQPSIYVSGNEYLIFYKNGVDDADIIPHSFEFADSKTLVLSEQCYDCYSHVYKRIGLPKKIVNH